jgi:copper resistance protein D
LGAEAALIAARFFHHGSALALFGLALFSVYSKSDWRPPIRAVSLAAIAASLAWLLVTTASMAGGAAAALDPSTLSMVVGGMGFGQVWAARMAILLAVVAASFGRPRHGLILSLAGLYLTGIALTGHTQVEEGGARIIHVAADAVHLLAAGAWLGGLFGLAAVLPRPDPEVGYLLKRFSRMGYWAVGLIVGSGVVNSLYLVGTVSALVGTVYGQLLLAKLAMVAGMAGLAFLNRFQISPRLYVPASTETAAPWLARLRRNVLLEQTLGLLVLAVVSALGTLEPAG